VFANCTAAMILDLDDGHRAASGHPGASIIPAVLAVAAETRADGPRTAAAIALGYELALRIAAARHLDRLDTFSTGRWCGFGVAAAIGYLRGLSRQRIAHALAIAGIHAPNMSASGYSRAGGHHVKEGIPWATVTGLAACDLAAAGFTGPLDILDHEDYFLPERILDGLGSGWWIETAYVKPYAGCRWLHAALDALIALMNEHALRADAIEAIEVETFSRALRLPNETAPRTLEAAQFSLPFCLALAAFAGADGLLPMRSEALQRSDVATLARRVRMRLDPELDRRFPGQTPARVTLVTASGRFTRQVEHPLGDVANPMSPEQLTRKFHALAAGSWSDARRSEALAAIGRLAATGPTALLDLLAAPARG
jgi:2-methylcitrate dehydratase PrpD